MSLKFIILGCGSSMGVPRLDGFFGKCNPKIKKNYRSRCSAIITSKNSNTLIDTSPDLRDQLLKHKIKNIDRVLYIRILLLKENYLVILSIALKIRNLIHQLLLLKF